MMLKEKVRCATFSAIQRAEDLVHIQYRNKTISTLEDLADSYHAFVELSRGKKVKVLTEIDDDAFFQLENNHCLTADHTWPVKEAIVTKNLASRLAMKFLYLDKQYHPVKTFKCKESALAWLNADN